MHAPHSRTSRRLRARRPSSGASCCLLASTLHWNRSPATLSLEPAMSTVLVTGGSGFVGSHVVLQLLNAGHGVRTTVRSRKKEDSARACHHCAHGGIFLSS